MLNANFAFLNTEAAINSATNLGAGAGLYSDKNGSSLEFKGLTSTGNSVTITSNSTSVNLEAVTSLHNDETPTLSNNLNLNNFYVYGGDIKSTVYGVNVTAVDALMSTLLEDNNFLIDMGSISSPTGYETESNGYVWDQGSILSPISSEYNFGDLTNNTSTSGVSLEGPNGTKLTLTNNFTTSGNYPITITATSASSVILPPTGVLATTASNLSQFASTTSAQLASVISDETGSGAVVFSASPTFTGTVTGTNISLGGYLYASGNFAINGTKFEVDSTTGNTIVAGTLNVTGTSTFTNVQTTGLTLRNVNFIAVSGTGTYALSTTTSYNVLVVAGTGYTTTVTFPPSPVDQQLVTFTVASNTTTLAMTAGPTVVPAFAGSATSGTVFQYVYRASNSTWYRN